MGEDLKGRDFNKRKMIIGAAIILFIWLVSSTLQSWGRQSREEENGVMKWIEEENEEMK